MTDIGKCPAFGYDCEYVSKVEAQAAEIERLKNDHASAVAELNKTKALLKGYRKGFNKARAALGETE